MTGLCLFQEVGDPAPPHPSDPEVKWGFRPQTSQTKTHTHRPTPCKHTHTHTYITHKPTSTPDSDPSVKTLSSLELKLPRRSL